jgi:NAD binding domain of 6-phosphogluconate dehydrogenase
MATDSAMQLGMLGLGRMGANLVRRLMCDGHHCVVYDMNADAVTDLRPRSSVRRPNPMSGCSATRCAVTPGRTASKRPGAGCTGWREPWLRC